MKKVTGSDLRAMRMVSGLTTVAMAKAAGVKTRKTYENWEKNMSAPSINQFMAMANACGLSAGEFISNFEMSDRMA